MKKIFLILLAFTTFSCGKHFGTNTGNPDQQGQEDQTPACGEARCLPYSYSIAQLIYGRLASCLQDPNQPSDFDKILNQLGLNSELPVVEKTFSELASSEANNRITINHESYSKCTSAISGLDCNSTVFKNAYNVNTPSDYSNIHKIFRAGPACVTTFTDK